MHYNFVGGEIITNFALRNTGSFPIKKYFECESNDFRGWGVSRSERVLKREPFFVSTYQEIFLIQDVYHCWCKY